MTFGQVPSANDTSDARQNTGGGSGALGGPAASSSGAYNTSYDYQAFHSNTSGEQSTAVGDTALQSKNGDDDTAIGSGALQNNTSGRDNVAVGAGAMEFSNGNDNMAVGWEALADNGLAGMRAALIKLQTNNKVAVQHCRINNPATEPHGLILRRGAHKSKRVFRGHLAQRMLPHGKTWPQ
jgi:hypothetical protein